MRPLKTVFNNSLRYSIPNARLVGAQDVLVHFFHGPQDNGQAGHDNIGPVRIESGDGLALVERESRPITRRNCPSWGRTLMEFGDTVSAVAIVGSEVSFDRD